MTGEILYNYGIFSICDIADGCAYAYPEANDDEIEMCLFMTYCTENPEECDYGYGSYGYGGYGYSYELIPEVCVWLNAMSNWPKGKILCAGRLGDDPQGCE